MDIFSVFANPLIGLDIQSDYIRVAVIKQSRQRFHLLQTQSHPAPPKLFREGKIEHFDQLSAFLVELAANLKVKHKFIATGISANLVHMQHLPLSHGLSDAEIEAEIQIHLQRQLPGLKDPLFIDFYLLPVVTPNEVTVVFTAVRAAYITSYAECFKRAGMCLKIVDVDIAARQRALTMQPDYQTWAAQWEVCESFQANPESFLTACGLGMREVPKW